MVNKKNSQHREVSKEDEKSFWEDASDFGKNLFRKSKKGFLYLATLIVGAGNLPASPLPTPNDSTRNEIKKSIMLDSIGTPKDDGKTLDLTTYMAENEQKQIQELKEKIINNHLAGTVRYSLKAYEDVVKGGKNFIKRTYADTYVKKKRDHYYCLRSHTKAIQDFAKDNNAGYIHNMFKGLPNLAGCPRFQEDITKRYPDCLYGDRNDYKKKNSTLTVYSKVYLQPENIKVGDIFYIESKTNTVSGFHALRAVGHEYDSSGKITSAIGLSLNGENFRRIGAEGELSTVDYPNYRELCVKTYNKIKGISINIAGIMNETLGAEIEKNIDKNLSGQERNAATIEYLNKYADNLNKESDMSLLYDKTGDDLLLALKEINKLENKNNDTIILKEDDTLTVEVRKNHVPQNNIRDVKEVREKLIIKRGVGTNYTSSDQVVVDKDRDRRRELDARKEEWLKQARAQKRGSPRG